MRISLNILFIIFCLIQVACQLQSPGVPESRELVARRTFARDVPAWFPNDAVQSGDRQVRRSSGAIPTSYAPLVNVASIADDVVQPPLLNDALQNGNKQSTVTTSPTSSWEQEKNDVLSRVSARCPGLEAMVNEAITTTDILKRIEKFQSVVRRCANSPDIWVWLGEDYLSQGNMLQARDAGEKALFLDRENAQAQSLVARVASKKSATTSTINK